MVVQDRLIGARPFLKWAGGKGQLIDKFTEHFPPQLNNGEIKRFVEPFVGGGAVFFHIAQSYSIPEFYLSDINQELILCYQTIQEDVEALIDSLSNLQDIYFRLSPADQKEYFYSQRTKLNVNLAKMDFERFGPTWIERAAQLIFLNRTCYNGLFRVNSKGEFNVPFGSYKNPRICDAENLRAVAQILQHALIKHEDFTACKEYVDHETFVYFDPPYRPISKTASFTSYSRYDFNEEAQKRLAEFFHTLDEKGAQLMLSNSDPKNENSSDDFFEKLYVGFHINRVMAARMINCDASKRGAIAELIITNY